VSTTGSADFPETTTNPDDPTPNAPEAALQTGFFRPRPSPIPRRGAKRDAPAADVGAAPEPDPSADTVIVGAPVRAGTPDHPATLPALAPATLPAAFAPVAPPPVAAEPPAYPEPQRSYPVKERKGWRRLLRRS
jgi:hypothetical protein